MTRKKRRTTRRPARQHRPAQSPLLITVYSNPDEPRITALVLTEEQLERGPEEHIALRAWDLFEDGIGVRCECEKSDCQADGLLIKPERAHNVKNQLLQEIEALRTEYGVRPDRVQFGTKVRGRHTLTQNLELCPQWLDQERIGSARARFLVTVMLEHPEEAVPVQLEDLPPQEEVEHRMAESNRLPDLAYGLLFYEGVMRAGELVQRVAEIGKFEPWVLDEDWLSIFKMDDRFRVRGDLVYRPEVRDIKGLMEEKEARRLPPKPFTAEQLLAAAEDRIPLTEMERKAQDALDRYARKPLSVREVQVRMRNTWRPLDVVSEILSHMNVRDADEANRAMTPIMDLWNATPRWEFRGRSPDEIGSEGPPQKGGIVEMLKRRGRR